MLKRMGILLLSLIIVLGLVGLLLPRTWHVERSIDIDATPDRVLPFVANLKRWQDWAVWTKTMDPKVSNTYGGPDEGVGARWQWQGPVMGHGAMTITKADPTGVTVEEAIESNEVNASGRFAFLVEGNHTKVTWTDEGQLPPMGGFFRPALEQMLGTNFEKGLKGLKALVEKQPVPQPLPPPSSLENLALPDAGL